MLNKNFSPWKRSLSMSNRRTQNWCFRCSGDCLPAKSLTEREEMWSNIHLWRKCGSSLKRNSELIKVSNPNRNTHKWFLGNSIGFLSTASPPRTWPTLVSSQPSFQTSSNMETISSTLFKWDQKDFWDTWLLLSSSLEVSQTQSIRSVAMLLKKLHCLWLCKIVATTESNLMSSPNSWRPSTKISIWIKLSLWLNKWEISQMTTSCSTITPLTSRSRPISWSSRANVNSSERLTSKRSRSFWAPNTLKEPVKTSIDISPTKALMLKLMLRPSHALSRKTSTPKRSFIRERLSSSRRRLSWMSSIRSTRRKCPTKIKKIDGLMNELNLAFGIQICHFIWSD